MFWKSTPKSPPKGDIFVVFIALKGGEGIAEHCESRDEMMKKYFKYSDIVQKESWISINDATIKTEIIRYIRWVVQ